MSSVRCRLLVDLVYGEELRRTLVGRSHFPQELIPDGAKRVTAFGDLRQVDVRVEIVEDVEVIFCRANRGVDPE
jgi:hypothetical protein